MSSNIARELQQVLKQRESELAMAQGEIEERNSLLTKASSVISSLQAEFQSLKKENELLRAESNKAYSEHQNQLNQSEEAYAQLEQRLAASSTATSEHLATIARLQADLNSLQNERDSDSQAFSHKLKEKEKKVAALTLELEASLDHSSSLERSLKEHKDRLSKKDTDLMEASRGFKEMDARSRKLADQKAALASQLEEAKEALAAQDLLAASLGSNVDMAKAEKATAEKEWMAKLEAEVREKEENIALLKKQLRDADVDSQDKMEAMERDWVKRAQEVELHWEKRLRDGMAACERKFAEEAGEWEVRLRDLDRQWQSRVNELDQVWESRLGQEKHMMDLERVQWENSRTTINADAKARAEEEILRVKSTLEKKAEVEREEAERDKALLERSLGDQMEESERSWVRRLEDVERAWTKKHDETKQRWASERVARDEDWAMQRSEMEARHHSELDEANKRSLKRVKEVEDELGNALDKAKAAWSDERSVLEAAHLDKMEEVREKGERQRAQLEAQHQRAQEEMEAKMTGITHKLLELTRRETTRDASRAELSRRLEELQESQAIEAQRRSEQEESLRSTIETYRVQLGERSRELDEVQRELRAAKMQASLAALRQPPSAPPAPPAPPAAAAAPVLPTLAAKEAALPKTSSFSFDDDSLEYTLAASKAARRSAEASLSGLLDLATLPPLPLAAPSSTAKASISGLYKLGEEQEVEEHAKDLDKAMSHAQALILSQPFPPSPAPLLVRHSSPPSYQISSSDLKRDLDETRATIARLAASSLPPSSVSTLFSTPERHQAKSQPLAPHPPSPPLFTPMPASRAYGASAKPPLPPPGPNIIIPAPPAPHPPSDLMASYYVTFPPSADNSFRVKKVGGGGSVDFDMELSQLRAFREQMQAEAFGSSRPEEKMAGPVNDRPVMSAPPQPAQANISDQVTEALSSIRANLMQAAASDPHPHPHPSTIAETAAEIEKSAARVLERARSPPPAGRTPAPASLSTPAPGANDDSTRRQLVQRLDTIAKKLEL